MVGFTVAVLIEKNGVDDANVGVCVGFFVDVGSTVFDGVKATNVLWFSGVIWVGGEGVLLGFWSRVNEVALLGCGVSEEILTVMVSVSHVPAQALRNELRKNRTSNWNDTCFISHM